MNRRRSGLLATMTAILLVVAPARLQALDVVIAWDPPTANDDGTPLVGNITYSVFLGRQSGSYERTVNAGDVTSARVGEIVEGATYYFASRAYSDLGTQSDLSEELAWTAPDVTAPVIEAPARVEVSADAAGACAVPDLFAGASVADNCTPEAEILREQTPVAGARLGTGEHAVALLARDASGNAARLTVTLVVTSAAAVERRPTLSWSTVEGATWYYLLIARNGRPYFSKWLNQTATSWTPDSDLPGGDYTWCVRAWGPGVGMSPWSPVSNFAIETVVPVAVEPCVDAVLGEPVLDVAWDAVRGASWYQVVVQCNGRPFAATWLQGQTEYRTGIRCGTYRLWMRAWGVDGFGPWSSPVDASYGVVTPAEPRFAGPEATARRPILSWPALGAAQRYELWVSANGRCVAHEWLDAAAWQPQTDLACGRYQWWVRAQVADGYGPWVAGSAFTLTPSLPGTVSSERVEAGPVAGSLRYVWRADAAAADYQVWINANGRTWFSTWTPGEAAGDGLVSLTVAGHTAGTRYQWWVRARNVDGCGRWSAPMSFVLD